MAENKLSTRGNCNKKQDQGQQKQKKHQDDVETGDKQSSSPQKSLNIEEKPQETVVPDTPATSATTVSPPTETGQPKTKKTSWWRRWFGRKKKTKHQTVTEDVTEKQNIPSSSATEKSIIKETEDGEAGNQEEASPTPHNPVPDATELQLQTEIKDIAEEGAIPTSSATEDRRQRTGRPVTKRRLHPPLTIQFQLQLSCSCKMTTKTWQKKELVHHLLPQKTASAPSRKQRAVRQVSRRLHSPLTVQLLRAKMWQKKEPVHHPLPQKIAPSMSLRVMEQISRSLDQPLTM
ncbi:uncharacterized protein [Trachinotus anak]|uniref:uncharacterized protein n=1 Tax=Trachinotus anak TaxID=443729 RepID=UPI0039F1B7E4